MRTPLVSSGQDYYAPHGQHTRPAVYSAMLRQVVRDYAGLPDYRTMTDREIRFFYEGLRPELKKTTKPQGK